MWRYLGPVILLLCSSISILAADGKPKERKAAASALQVLKSQAAVPLSVSFVEVPGGAKMRGNSSERAALDMGRVSAVKSFSAGVDLKPAKNRFTISTVFGIQVGSPNTTSSQMVTLSAFSLQPQSVYTLRLDGVTLSTIPRSLGAPTHLGALSEHKLEIDIPTDQPAASGDAALMVGVMAVPN